MEYRFLADDEFYRITPVFEEYGSLVPLPALSKVAIAEETDALSFYVFQLLPHAEPMYIHPKHRGTKVWFNLAQMLKPLAVVRPTFIVAENAESVKMCEALGLKRIPHPVYVMNGDSPKE